jgi:hypothetical protein
MACAVAYIDAVSLTDDQLDRVRRSPAYRRALWFARLMVLPWLGGIVTGAAAVFGKENTMHLFGAFWLVGVVLAIVTVVLMHAAGVPFVRRGLSWELGDARLSQSIYRDLLWRRPL